MNSRVARLGICLVLFIACALSSQRGVLRAEPRPTGTIDTERSEDPVVLRGDRLPWSGAMPRDAVAFAYRGEWLQIPVQIDERDVVEYSQIYGDGTNDREPTTRFGVSVFEEVYCDPDTFTGMDSDPAIDENDELVFMFSDAGSRAPGSIPPAGVIPGSGVEVALADPLTAEVHYVYLFLQDGSLDPAAGQAYVEYTFGLLSGDYIDTYNTYGIDPESGQRTPDHGPQLNPEDSVIRTEMYERHWSYRWTCDGLSLLAGENLVEREDYWIAPGACGRHNGTFNAQEGAFIANISGPVRAIRSFIGANSGPLVQMDRIYYRAREDVTIDFRVHPRAAVGIFYVDHTAAAIGMQYMNDRNPEGVLIDGHPDRLDLGAVQWELISGDPGSVVRIHELKTDIAFPDGSLSLFYEDNLNTDITQCSACLEGCRNPFPLGDEHMIGASGVWNTAPLPNTDPALFATNYLTSILILYYGDPGWDAQEAERRLSWRNHPIDVEVSTWLADNG